jgi:hypothetical protein
MLVWLLWMQGLLNCARFRWASMQLQYLCSFRFDNDIKKSLGRLPPDLYTLYGDLYDVLSKTPGERGAMVFNNVLRWLLCAQRRLNTDEFLAVVSVDPSDNTDLDPIAQEDVLDICNNFVVFDDQLNTFRFAHLSVREFLEQRLNILEANMLMAEICLWSVLSDEDEVATTDLLRQLELRASPVSAPSYESQRRVPRPSTPSEILYGYAVVYWATHCKLAGVNRESGALRSLLQHMLSYEPSFVRWNVQVLAFLIDEFCAFQVQNQLEDAMKFHTEKLMKHLWDAKGGRIAHYLLGRKVRRKLRSPDVLRMSILAVCCVFDLGEQGESVLGDQMGGLRLSEHQQSLQLAAKYGSCSTIQQLLMTRHWTNMQISNEVIETAANNSDNAKELIMLLFNHPGGTAAVSEEELRAAADNTVSGEAVMPLLLRRLRRDIAITPESVEAAAGNSTYGYHVMRFLLDQLGADVTVTPGMVKSAASNAEYGNQVLQLLFDRAGADMPVTTEIVKEAAGNKIIKEEVIIRLLDQLGSDIPVTLDVVQAAAGNVGIQKRVMIRLLDRLGSDIPVTLDVVQAAAGNKRIKEEVMTRLLDQLGSDIPITLDVVQAAAGNKGMEKEVMIRLLDQLGSDIPVTLDIVQAAAGNEDIEEEVMIRLLDQLGSDIPITLDVVQAAAGNVGIEEEITRCLLDRLEAGASITAEFTATFVRYNGADLIAFLLDQRGADVQITDDVVKAAVNWDKSVTRRKMTVLLKRLEQSDAPITVGMARSIMEHSPVDLMASFLDQRGADVPIVKTVVRAAVSGLREEAKKKMVVLLEHREREILEVLEQLPDERWTGRFEVLNARLARVEYDEEWIYWRRNKTGSVSEI